MIWLLNRLIRNGIANGTFAVNAGTYRRADRPARSAVRTQTNESARRRRQIERGQLTASNGLVRE